MHTPMPIPERLMIDPADSFRSPHTPIPGVNYAPSPVPEWLTTAPVEHPIIPESQRLHETFENVFESMLDRIVMGENIRTILSEDHRTLDRAMFLRWVFKDSERERRYEEAERIGTEMIAAELLEIADGTGDAVPEDVRRSELRINNRKWVIQRRNRRKYGDVTKIEMDTTISVRKALDMARERVIEGAAVRLDESSSVIRSTDDENNNEGEV